MLIDSVNLIVNYLFVMMFNKVNITNFSFSRSWFFDLQENTSSPEKASQNRLSSTVGLVQLFHIPPNPYTIPNLISPNGKVCWYRLIEQIYSKNRLILLIFLFPRRKMTFSKFFPHDENQVCCIAQLINFVDEFISWESIKVYETSYIDRF